MREAGGVSPTGEVTYRRLPFLIRLLQAEVAHFAIGGHGDGCVGLFRLVSKYARRALTLQKKHNKRGGGGGGGGYGGGKQECKRTKLNSVEEEDQD